MIVKKLQPGKRGDWDPADGVLGISIAGRKGKGRVKIYSDLAWAPAIDIIETEKELIVAVDIAGMNARDISVVTDGNIMKISGFRKNISIPGKKRFHKLEIRVGHFERIIELPVPVEHSKVSAGYDNGLLQIKIQKIDPSSRVRKVEID